ncbi:hypothetical protein Pelo_7331 [Pelomyxa schiedti]|nr:hypothetical protein Pelo_7331 [Pelomyxa schiedti]
MRKLSIKNFPHSLEVIIALPRGSELTHKLPSFFLKQSEMDEKSIGIPIINGRIRSGAKTITQDKKRIPQTSCKLDWG